MKMAGNIQSPTPQHCHMEWRLDSFAQLFNVAKFPTKSQTFDEDSDNWVIEVTKESNADWIRIRLLAKTLKSDRVITRMEILDADGNCVNKRENFGVRPFAPWGHIADFVYTPKSLLDAIDIEGNLHVRADVFKYQKETKFEVEHNDETIGSAKITPLATEVLCWFQSEHFGDITIVAKDGLKFRCQKDILARRIPFFQPICSSKDDYQVERYTIDDFNGKVVTAVLQYVYTDQVEIDDDFIEDLCAAAQKYHLDRLMKICEAELIDQIYFDSIVKSFRLASRFSMANLSSKSAKFVQKHRCDAKLPWEYLYRLPAEFPDLAEVFGKLSLNY